MTIMGSEKGYSKPITQPVARETGTSISTAWISKELIELRLFEHRRSAMKRRGL
jgi:hypothetical protein